MFIECDCSITDAGDCNQLQSTIIRRARKNHLCVECGECIPAGKLYTIDNVLCDGHWSTFKTCTGCTAIRNHLCSGGYFFGELAEQVEECIGFNYLTPLEELED